MRNPGWMIVKAPAPHRWLIAGLVLCLLLAMSWQLVDAQVVSSTQNPKQLALLRWYLANQTTLFPLTATDDPETLAFDGANIWVAAFQTLFKFRPSDGKLLLSIPQNIRCLGGFGYNMAFDGANIWLTQCTNPGLAIKYRASDGTKLGTFTAGNGASALAFDGANMWVANISGNSVTKLRASDGANLGSVTAGNSPVALAFDGSNIWVANMLDNTVMEFQASTGNKLGTFNVGLQPVSLVFDGAYIWVANRNDSTIWKLRASDGACITPCIFTGVTGPAWLAYDGANIWAGSDSTSPVTVLRASNGVIIGQFGQSNNTGGPLVFDGANVWTLACPGCTTFMLEKF